MAGMVGFEPTILCTKNRCLTTWLHPNTTEICTMDEKSVQDLISFLLKLSYFLITLTMDWELFFCSNYLTNQDPFLALMKVKVLYNLDMED